MKILITGGTGFFGRALLRNIPGSFNLADLSVTVISRSPATFLSKFPEFEAVPWLNFHTGNILDIDSFSSLGGFTHIIHAATESTLGSRLSPLDRYNEITVGTRNVLEFARQQPVHRILLTSSGGVYGSQPSSINSLEEGYTGSPCTMRVEESYSQAKRASEHLCSLYSEAFGIEVVIARCFSFVGLDLPLTSHFAIGNFIYDALYGDEIVVRSNGDVIRSYMAQEDLAFWLLTVLVKGRNRTTYNVGSDVAISLRDLAFLIRDILAPSIPVQIKGCDDENLFRKKYVPNITRCQTELNLRIKISLEAAIEQFRPFK